MDYHLGQQSCTNIALKMSAGKTLNTKKTLENRKYIQIHGDRFQ